MLTSWVFNKVRDKGPDEAPPPQKAADLRRYFLEVSFEVRPADHPSFARQSRDLVPTFKSVGLHPRYSFSRPQDGLTRVVNYWDLGTDANQLLEAELALPDVPSFNSFNTIVRREVKNLVLPIASEERISPPLLEPGAKLSGDEFRYLRVQCEVSNNNFSEFVARVEGYLARTTSLAGWYLGDTYYGITGQEGIVSQVWLVPVRALDGVEKQVRAAYWLRDDVAERIQIDLFTPTLSDPLLTAGGEPKPGPATAA